MEETGDEYVSTARLLEIMAANFVAAAFVASPIGIILWYLGPVGGGLRQLLIFFVLWPISWGLFSLGRAWQRNRQEVLFPGPLGQVLERLGMNGEVEEFSSLLYLPGVQIPSCRKTHPLTPKFLR